MEWFYDLEAFANLFTCAIWCPQTKNLTVFYICDEASLLDSNGQYKDVSNCIKRIWEENSTLLPKDFKIEFRNLRNEHNASICTSSFVKKNIRYMPLFLSDTDTGYNKDNSYRLFGYNSANYDLTMLSFYFSSIWRVESGVDVFNDCISAKDMYDFNNLLFTSYKEKMTDALGTDTPMSNIYWSMINSGRHIDVSNLNEKQNKVGLKRVLGMLGYQIKESSLLDEGNTAPIKDFEMFNNAIAYNVSDICGLEKLFRHDIYASNYELKEGLLEEYPELIYDRSRNRFGKPEGYAPKISPANVKRGRLRIDSTSASFATKCLCPYDRLKDSECVSFRYPSLEVCKELGIEQINVLDDLYNWYKDKFKDFPNIVASFKRNIYDHYKRIEGKNFNSGANYEKDYGKRVCYNIDTLAPVVDTFAPKVPFNGCVPYYYADGTSSGCYAQFSNGGIHGAEYNARLYAMDWMKANKEALLLKKVKQIYPNPFELRKSISVEIDGETYSYTNFLKSGASLSDPSKSTYKEVAYPQLFKMDAKSKKYALNKKYTYTSSTICDHEDFSSYYPSLLINQKAMYNDGLGYDRYAEIYGKKEEYGDLSKKEDVSKKEAAHYKILRGGTKLILNSASGAGDLSYDTPVRMNNKIISMRLIGQFFTFRLAQEQTLVGARVPSTNTDGIYVETPNKDLTRGILADFEKIIHVKIEPEEMILISKDTNNRLELSVDGNEVLSASGGTLACYKKPSPDKALAHPAIIDNSLVAYLKSARKDLSVVPDKEVIVNYLKNFINTYSVKYVLLMFQNIVSNSSASGRFNTLVKNYTGNMEDINLNDCTVLQKYNRMFFVREGCSNEHLILVSQKDASSKVAKNQTDAVKLLASYGIKELKDGKIASFGKVSGVSPDKCVRIYNKPIVNSNNQEELEELVRQLDLEEYASLIVDKFADCWANLS